MWLLTHGLATVRTLSADERSLIESHVDSALKGQEEIRANNLLRRIRQDSHWLGCDCCTPMPVMNLALKDTGKIVLRNNPDGADHVPACPFSRESARNSTERTTVAPSVVKIGPESHVTLHSEFSVTGKGNGQQISRSSAVDSVARTKKLLSLLLTFMDKSELSVYSPATKTSVADQYAALRLCSSRFTLSPGLPLDAYMDTRISRQRLVAMSVKLRAANEFKNNRRAGLLLDNVSGVKGRTIELTGGATVDFFGRVERAHAPSYPALALVTVTAQQNQTSFFEIGHVAIVPVLSNSLFFPVICDHDRECVHKIFGLLDWFFTAKSIEITANRHLFAVDGGEILELRSRRLIVRVDFSTAENNIIVPPDTYPEVLRFSDYGSITGLKKAITKRFLGAHSA